MANVLIVDDDELVCEMLCVMVEDLGHQPFSATTLNQAYKAASSRDVDVVFLDIRMPDGNGLELLPKLRHLPAEPEVIIVTGLGDADGAELAIKNGAWDYIQKSSSTKEMTLTFLRALQYREEKRGRKPHMALKLTGIVGSSERMKVCYDLLAQAASSEVNVLIVGETGTGKELFARAVHENSDRKLNNFVVVDCTALPETLVESVLFGYERGAFTGADKSHEGLIRQAEGGTLFLDEIGELPVSMQKSFLRVLQERRFRPVGGKSEVEVDFRLVSATNKNLDAMGEAGLFRKDLLFRLRTLTVELPPLRERVDDIKELTISHMTRLCDQYRIATKGFSPEFFDALAGYEWPGNVRELVHAVERMLADAPDVHTLFPRHLPTNIRVKLARTLLEKQPAPEPSDVAKDEMYQVSIEEYRIKVEYRYLYNLLASTGSNIREACRISGLSRSHLYALLKKHGLNPSR